MTQFSPLYAPDGSMEPSVGEKVIGVIRAGFDRLVRLPIDIYRIILANLVPNCVDVIVLDPDNNVLVGYRVNEPWKDRWHPSGGRQFPGDSYGDTGSDHLERDLGLKGIHPTRFHFIVAGSYPWSASAQGVPNQTNGTIVAVCLTHEELARRTVPKKGDFNQSKFVPIAEVVVEDGFHPLIELACRMIEENLTRGRLGTINPELLAKITERAKLANLH